jgi:hypothetical protein
MQMCCASVRQSGEITGVSDTRVADVNTYYLATRNSQLPFLNDLDCKLGFHTYHLFGSLICLQIVIYVMRLLDICSVRFASFHVAGRMGKR